MGVVTITLDDNVEEKLRELAKGKGALGKAISVATQEWLEKQQQEALKKKLRALMQKGWPMGKILYKKREELYDR
jgi:predicted transcriptional regulator